jgi:hypothetical protein
MICKLFFIFKILLLQANEVRQYHLIYETGKRLFRLNMTTQKRFKTV